MEILCKGSAYGDLSLGFVLSQEQLAEEGVRIQAVALLSQLIEGWVTFGDGFVTTGNDNDPILGKTSKFGSFETGGKDGIVNDKQLCLGRVKLVQQFIDREGRVGRSGDGTEPVDCPGGDGEFDVVGGEESDTVVVADVPAGFHDVGESVGAGSDLLEVIAPARVVVNEPW